jgi:hypothetical protein
MASYSPRHPPPRPDWRRPKIRDARLNMRISSALREQILQAATSDGLELTTWLEKVIVAALDRRQRQRQALDARRKAG